MVYHQGPHSRQAGGLGNYSYFWAWKISYRNKIKNHISLQKMVLPFNYVTDCTTQMHIRTTLPHPHKWITSRREKWKDKRIHNGRKWSIPVHFVPFLSPLGRRQPREETISNETLGLGTCGGRGVIAVWKFHVHLLVFQEANQVTSNTMAVSPMHTV